MEVPLKSGLLTVESIHRRLVVCQGPECLIRQRLTCGQEVGVIHGIDSLIRRSVSSRGWR
jgi:hypothetical protein